MVQKTISLTPEAFEKLKRAKDPGESYSDLVLRLVGKEKGQEKPHISDFFGTLVEVEEGEWDTILDNLYQARSRPRSKDTRLDD
jgi:predicted CopG family antitoxin